jgi:Resolvase, N terminal domain
MLELSCGDRGGTCPQGAQFRPPAVSQRAGRNRVPFAPTTKVGKKRPPTETVSVGAQSSSSGCDEFTEIESGKRADRPELEKALAPCKKQRAKLVIAKLDRLSRNLASIATLMESGVEFVAVDNPHANKLTIHILAAVAQHEREMISERTKAALQAAKKRGAAPGRLPSSAGLL